jgi:hypothetical protein
LDTARYRLSISTLPVALTSLLGMPRRLSRIGEKLLCAAAVVLDV